MLRRLTISYEPQPGERSFLERAHTRREGEVEITVAVPSDRETEQILGVRLSNQGLQAVWLEVVNSGREGLWLDRVQIDRNYYTPLEAAQLSHFSMGKRLVAFGLLGWLFLPLLPLLPFRLLGARSANHRMDNLFRTVGFPTSVISAGEKARGFLFTPLDEGVKRLRVRLLGRGRLLEFSFTVEVPGLALSFGQRKIELPGETQQLDEAGLRTWLERQPRATSNEQGTLEGDPLNLVVVGDLARIQECFGAWDETESLTLGTAWKTAKAFLLESRYRYSPVSPL